MVSNLEIEAKAHADDLEALESQLKERGAEFLGEVDQTDLYFSHPARDFRWTDEALRVRWSDKRARVTYKGPRLDKITKTRKELEVDVLDPDMTIKILQSLSFAPVGRVIKRRRRYQLGQYKICLDDVEGLGKFVEVETAGENVEGLKEGALELLKTLGLDRTERCSYLELLKRACDD